MQNEITKLSEIFVPGVNPWRLDSEDFTSTTESFDVRMPGSHGPREPWQRTAANQATAELALCFTEHIVLAPVTKQEKLRIKMMQTKLGSSNAPPKVKDITDQFTDHKSSNIPFHTFKKGEFKNDVMRGLIDVVGGRHILLPRLGQLIKIVEDRFSRGIFTDQSNLLKDRKGGFNRLERDLLLLLIPWSNTHFHDSKPIPNITMNAIFPRQESGESETEETPACC
eukprot:GHVP01057539.1.p1 GENE.GHVP01057539.1~~GHVP01057539.1.p1  ORF type:complete len:237 (-),score=25.64 GHVP01057539.1:94-768(-)